MAVDSLMDDQITALGKAFEADVAAKGFLSGVNSFVLFLITFLRKSFAAVLTRER